MAERGGSFGSDKKGLRHSQEQRKLQEKTKEEPFPPSYFSRQTDAEADGGELAGNGQRRNETMH